MHVNGDNDEETQFKIEMNDMLFSSKDENKTDICVLPFYQLNKNAYPDQNTWIIGSIIQKQYYQVYDLAHKDGEIMLRMGEKNPNYQKKPDVPGGGPDDKPKNIHKTEIVVIILATIMVIATLWVLLLCI